MIDNIIGAFNYCPETGLITRKNDGTHAFKSLHPKGYRQGSYNRKNFLAHRIAWLLHYGCWPSGQVDHIDGDKTNNRIRNLRDVTPSQNRRNTRYGSRCRHGKCGIRFRSDTGHWHARITINGKEIGLGRYKCLSAAIISRAAAETKFGFSKRHGR